jgi:hypothetical protein
MIPQEKNINMEVPFVLHLGLPTPSQKNFYPAKPIPYEREEGHGRRGEDGAGARPRGRAFVWQEGPAARTLGHGRLDGDVGHGRRRRKFTSQPLVPKSKKERKSISRQVNLAISSPLATKEYLRWSDHPVNFSRADHPRKVPRPGHSPMVLKAQIGGYDIGRVFIDAGSGINLIYARTLKAMCISLSSLKPTDCSFHVTVPGATNYPLGKIELNICFGSSSNYHREKLEFEVMDWPSQYHTILGRPAFAKFMAVPHYAYLMLKILGPKVMITVQGSFEVANTCDREFNRMAQTFGMTAEYERLKGETDHNVLPDIG